ncbi:MAG TPA: aspartate aminotransferase family protein [Limnochordia bacterium]|nr:aspartate aminotransferase family protein [Limnochordia bacterium]
MNQDRSAEIFARNAQVIAGGVVSLNRLTEPKLAFSRAQGAHLWDVDGNRYIDYHLAFAPHILGHNDPVVNAAVSEALQRGESLYGSGTTQAEGELAALICELVPGIEQVQLTNTGSEATYHAVRIARAHTGREHLIVMQGGYNGWHNDVAVNLMTPLAELGPRVSPGEYPLAPLTAGVPQGVLDRLHAVNFNDLDSIEYVMRRYPVAGVILEPVLQNIGVVPPLPGYLAGLRALCDRYGAVLIFDEVKTGFRAALGGYQSVAGVRPDLTILGKAVANGFPLGVIGGSRKLMQHFVDPDPKRRVMIAGTYNAHPVSTAAGLATLGRLSAQNGAIYAELEQKTERLAQGLAEVARNCGVEAIPSRVGSAFCLYFMDHAPTDWHDLAQHHDAALDTAFRRELISRGSYAFPLASKQWSLSAAHTDADLAQTLAAAGPALVAAQAAVRPAKQAGGRA